ncbi:hypothetical protein CCACVL1_21625 [Corchorus capsularis]|uniref:Uncharacterized protein n=1 Tax=Corchorus capsularis TaxID=210143 RepID=A0A1R3H2U6_COCAP|nr:hypothetical protein CCACVL1_21625 [Corchorus capsularis]
MIFSIFAADGSVGSSTYTVASSEKKMEKDEGLKTLECLKGGLLAEY